VLKNIQQDQQGNESYSQNCFLHVSEQYLPMDNFDASTSREHLLLHRKEKMQRLLLLYTEIAYLKAKWYLTYDTGCPQLDKTIHSILGGLLAKPTSMTRKQAKQYAKTLYLSCNHLIEMSHVPGPWPNRSLSIIATTFQTWYRRPYASERESNFPAWQDTSRNRNR